MSICGEGPEGSSIYLGLADSSFGDLNINIANGSQHMDLHVHNLVMTTFSSIYSEVVQNLLKNQQAQFMLDDSGDNMNKILKYVLFNYWDCSFL